MLSDDIIQLVMARDRMTADAMRRLASEVRDRAGHAGRLPTDGLPLSPHFVSQIVTFWSSVTRDP